MPSPGDSIRVSYAAGVGSNDYNSSGPAYTWDFSSLLPIAQQELRYITPTAIPFAFIATVSHVNPSPDSLAFIGNVPSDLTDQYKKSSSSFREVGFSFSYAPLGNFSVPIVYSNPDYIYRFPLNYSNTDTSDAHWSFNAQSFGLFFIDETIHRTNNADGWGTLITPFGTFQCVREVSVVTTTDSIATDSVTGYMIARPIHAEYKWLATGMKIPVLEVDADLVNNAEVVTNVVYQDSLRNNVFQVGIPVAAMNNSFWNIYPVPANENFMITGQSASNDKIEICIYDIEGRPILRNTKITDGNGTFRFDYNASEMEQGTYLVIISSKESCTCRKLVISR